jgi:hypothetical protein
MLPLKRAFLSTPRMPFWDISQAEGIYVSPWKLEDPKRSAARHHRSSDVRTGRVGAKHVQDATQVQGRQGRELAASWCGLRQGGHSVRNRR